MNILILEDDKDLAVGIEISLKQENYRFVISNTIKDAKKQLNSYVFDLLILDINLPDGSGFDLCKEIRSVSKILILLLTARDMDVDIVRGLESGADDYITKPFSMMVLRSRIRSLLRRSNWEQMESKYDKGEFKFDFFRMEFYKNGELIELSRTEQRILYILVTNEGHILTRERLLEWVWSGGGEYVEDNALSVGIKRLRTKLESIPSKPEHIKTIYGKGYIWEC